MPSEFAAGREFSPAAKRARLLFREAAKRRNQIAIGLSFRRIEISAARKCLQIRSAREIVPARADSEARMSRS